MNIFNNVTINIPYPKNILLIHSDQSRSVDVIHFKKYFVFLPAIFTDGCTFKCIIRSNIFYILLVLCSLFDDTVYNVLQLQAQLLATLYLDTKLSKLAL